jgi:copper chaperone CopZ
MKKVVGLLMMMFVFQGIAQKVKKVEIIEIQTSALCGECKERIEDKLNFTKGVKFADLNLDNKVVTVKFKTKQTNAKEIKSIIAMLGYHASDVSRNKESFEALPGCCKDENASCTKK